MRPLQFRMCNAVLTVSHLSNTETKRHHVLIRNNLPRRWKTTHKSSQQLNITVMMHVRRRLRRRGYAMFNTLCCFPLVICLAVCYYSWHTIETHSLSIFLISVDFIFNVRHHRSRDSAVVGIEFAVNSPVIGPTHAALCVLIIQRGAGAQRMSTCPVVQIRHFVQLSATTWEVMM